MRPDDSHASPPVSHHAFSQALAHLSQTIVACTNLDELLNVVARSLRDDFGYHCCAIFLSSSTETTFKLKASSTEPDHLPPPRNLPVPVQGRTIISRAAAEADLILCNNIQESSFSLFDYFGIEARSEIAVPLLVGKQVVGVLDVQSQQPHRYGDEDCHRLQTIAAQLALAIENNRLVKERDKRLVELATFNQIGMIIADHRDLETIFSNTVQRIRNLFRVEGASLLVLEDNNLRFVAASGTAAEEIRPFILKPGQGIAWSVVETQETIQVDDVKNDPRHFADIDLAIGFNTRSLLAVPIRLQDRILGVLEVMNRLDGQPFNRDDVTILEFIVSSVAVSIENARLFDQTRRQVDRVTGLLQASYTLSTLNLEDTLNTIVRQAGNLLEANHTVVYLVDYEARQIKPTAVHSVGDMKGVPTPPFDFESGTAAWVIKHRESLRINDVRQDSRFKQVSPESKRIKNLVAVPLIVKNEVIGVLEATHKLSQGGFGLEDESLLTAFASQAVIAIQHARLYREKQQQIRALTTLTQASEAITKAGTLDQLLNIVLNSAMSIIAADGGAVVLVNSESQTLRIEAAHGIAAQSVEAFNRLNLPKKTGLFGEIYRRREIIDVEPGHNDPAMSIDEQIPWDLPGAFTNIPLISAHDFIGFITLYGLPHNDDPALLQAVADMAAVAIDKARLFDEIGQRLAEVSTLYTLAEQMTRVLDLDRVIEYSVTILKHALDCQGCCLFLKKTDDAPFELKSHIGWPVGSERLITETNHIARLAEQLTTRPYPIYLKDVKEANPLSGEGVGSAETPILRMRSVMIVPLVVKEEVIGALSITARQPDAFSQAEGRLLTIAAAQISTAIENIRLYDNLERRAVELEAALNEVAEANRLKSEFVQNISHELRTPLTFILSYVELILEGTLGDIPPVIREKLEIVSQKSQVTTRLVNDIISLQKIEAGNLQLSLMSPAELVERATHGAVANASEYGIDIVSTYEPDLPPVQVDVDRIGQVFDNLVTNALKFSPADSVIRINAAATGEHIVFSVQDQGIGIPADKLDKVFDRFYQVDGSTTRRYGGAGLGLAIIKQIVEVHNGEIKVDSTVGEGTTFTFWLPVYREIETC